jgi:hypothetical protein
MANYIVTPNMSLPNPVPGQDPGPDYADNLEASLNQIDQHNHSAGQGVQIQPNGLNISSDLPFNGNNATILKTVRFLSQASPIANSTPNVGCLYVSGNELWYNDYTGGNQVQITSNGTINATSSGIASGTASAAFSAGTLVVKSSSTSYANIDMQSAVLSNSGNLTNQLTLQAPTLSSSYTISLPTVPSQLSVMTLDSSGNMGTTMNSTAADPVGQAMSSVGANAIAATMTATGANAVANTRTRATSSTVGAGGVAYAAGGGTTTSTTPGAVSGLSVTITTTGRPVMVMITTVDNSSSFAQFAVVGTGTLQANLYILNGSTVIYAANSQLVVGTGSRTLTIPPSFSTIDLVPAGTYTYTVQIACGFSSSTAGLTGVTLVAYEL